jgi:hypothetical protein
LPSISAHRLARAALWAALVLMRLAQIAEQFARSPWLDMLLAAPAARLRRLVFALIVMHAGRRCPAPPPRPKQPPRAAPPGFALRRRCTSARRAGIGARLRRRVRGNPRAMMAALLTLLANLEPEIARMTRRFARGFTRGRALVAVAPPALTLIARAEALAPAPADTS